MKNFVRFEKAYKALKDAQRALVSIPSWSVNEIGENEFRAKRAETAKGINASIELLREWFKENFPRDTAAAYHSDQFTFPAFFAMLRAYPE